MLWPLGDSQVTLLKEMTLGRTCITPMHQMRPTPNSQRPALSQALMALLQRTNPEPEGRLADVQCLFSLRTICAMVQHSV